MDCPQGYLPVQLRLGDSSPAAVFFQADFTGIAVGFQVEGSPLRLDLVSGTASPDGSITVTPGQAPPTIPSRFAATPWTRVAISISESKKAELIGMVFDARFLTNGQVIGYAKLRVVTF